MREILFRGKRTDNHQWVEGYYIVDDMENPNPYIVNRWKYRVAHKTVGQYTGLKDKNGKRIFEGDVLDCKSGMYERCKVIFNEFCSAFQLMYADGFSDFFLCSLDHTHMEVIGNIHDNPELIGGNNG